MTPSDSEDRLDGEFSRLLAAYDESLASGQSTALDGADLLRHDPALLCELEAACECLRQLERKWPRSCGLLTQLGSDADPDDLPDSLVRELPRELARFEIQRRLGQGGHGVVFLAFDTLLRRPVALKLPRPDSLMTPRLRQRFLREARATAVLKHPNLITVYDAGEAGPLCYIAEAYCDGPNLSTWLQQQREPVPPRLAADLVRKLAAAVAHAHACGIIHRDLKPSNVLLEPCLLGREQTSLEDKETLPFVPKVTDFGLAKLLDTDGEQAATVTLSICGTAPYMAPEQAEGRRDAIGAPTDVYALGVLLYEILTGQTPFRGAAAPEILRRIVFDDATPPRRLRPDVPRDLEAICLKCLEKLPARRYETAEALAEDLDRFLAGKPTAARPVGRSRRAAKWVRRRPALAALASFCALAIMALIAGSWWHVVQLHRALTETDAARIRADRQRDRAVYQEGLAREREAKVRRYLYAVDMRQALAAWNNSHLAEMIGLLERHRPKPGEEDQRSFPWYYLWRVAHSQQLRLVGHASDVRSVAFAPDGKTLATAGFDGTVRLWDAATGKELTTFLQGHKDEQNTVAFSPDGKTLASGGDDRVIRLWDVAGGRERLVLAGHADDVNAVAFSPDGKTLASGSLDRVARLWDVATGREIGVLKGHRGAVEALAFSPDGKTLATASGDNTTILWDLADKTQRRVLRMPGTRTPEYFDVVYAVAFFHGGRTLATAGEDCAVTLWDARSGELRGTLRGPNEVVRSVAISPDDRTLAAATGEGSVLFWDVATNRLLRTIRANAGRTWSAAYSPNGTSLATAGSDQVVKLWRADFDQRARFIAGLPAGVSMLNLTADGKMLAINYWKSAAGIIPPAEFWEIGASVERRPVPLPDCESVALAATGSALAVFVRSNAPYRLSLFDGPRWQLRSTIELPKSYVFFWSPDGRTLVTASSREKTPVELWNPLSGRRRAIFQEQTQQGFNSGAWNPDGTKLATGSLNGRLTVWDIETARPRATVQANTDAVYGVAFAPDGQTIATCAADRMVRIWDARTLKELATLPGHQNIVRGVAFCPDRSTLASVSDDGTLRLWDTGTWQEMLVLEAHKGGAGQAAFSADGELLVTARAAEHEAGEVALWSAPRAEAAFRSR